MILQEIKIVTEEYNPKTLDKTIITIPTYFNDSQQQTTKDAEQIANLDMIRIINEPTATTLTYDYGKDLDKLITIFDLDGRTFDISILEIDNDKMFKIVATADDTFLNNEDFDAHIMDFLVRKFDKEHNVNLREDRMTLQRLKDATKKAKCELSTVTKTKINLPFIISVEANNEALHLQRTITHDTLEELVKDLVEQCMEIYHSTLNNTEIETNEMNELMLIGNMTRIPMVQKAVTDYLKREPYKGIHPDEIVTSEATIQTYALTEEAKDVILLDVTPHALNILTFNKVLDKIIPQNTTVPTNETKIFTTSHDDQTTVKILVMQRENRSNQLLDEFLLTDLRATTKGEVEIEIMFSIDANDIVSISTKDLKTSQKQSIKVTTTSNLTKDEIDEMMKNAKNYLIKRRSNDEYETTEQQTEKLVTNVEKLFPDVEKIVTSSDFDREAIDKTKVVLNKTKVTMDEKDLDGLKEHSETLARTLRMFKDVVSQPH